MLRPTETTIVVACGALVRELRSIDVEATYLPAPLHNRPTQIPDAVEQSIRQSVADASDEGKNIGEVLVGYGDCGTGGQLDALITQLSDELRVSIRRLPGDHCYSFLAGQSEFESIHEQELGTFFLTDYLARHFNQLVWKSLKMDKHSELRDLYFGNYKRVVYLAQTDDPDKLGILTEMAASAATKLGLAFERRLTGLGPLNQAVKQASTTRVSLSGSH